MYFPMSWHKPARIGAALVLLLSAAGVYLAMGERRIAPPAKEIPARDPLAKVEISGCNLKNFPGLTKNFEVTCDLMSTYDDGRVKLTGNPVTILVHKGKDRTFKITGKEVRVSRDSNYFEVFGGPVRLEDSNGFWLETDTATANQADSISHVPGAATFGKGRMKGSGIGFSYDSNREVLLISKQARVKTVDEHGKVVTDMASGTAMLDRLQHLLTLDTGVHVLRDGQVIDTDHATGRLSAGNDVVTGIELYGNSRVVGGPSIDNMKARDITLDYTDDGKTLEAAKLIAGASIAMKGDGGAPGRRIDGETVDVTLAPDGMLTSAVARENVRLDLPGDADAPRRSITAQTLDGTGEAGKGLTQVTFTRDVSFTEEPLRSKGASADNQSDMRTAKAQRLEASLADDAVTNAAFSTDVTFEEAGLKACAATADYSPQKGTLSLSGSTKAGRPMVAEEKVAIEAQTVDVALDTRKMIGQGDVRAFFRSREVKRCQPSKERPSAEQGATNVPRLLKADAPVTVVAPMLDYDSKKGIADFKGKGRATLVQEDGTQRTQISADQLLLDQTKGDLTAIGDVKSSLPLDGKDTRTQSHRMGYSDEQRFITFSSQPKTPNSEVSLLSTDSTIRAAGVDITLDAKENKAKTMRAKGNVRLAQDPHKISGGATLDYTASTEQFEVRGDRGQKVTVITRDGDGCRQNEGNLVTFTKGKDAVSVDGQIRNSKTAPLKTGSCAPSTR